MKVDEQLLSRLVNLLNSIIVDVSNRKLLINEFQIKMWDVNNSSLEYEILSELANDLDYYESDSDVRREDPSYYGDDRLLKEIKSAINRLSREKLETN